MNLGTKLQQTGINTGWVGLPILKVAHIHERFFNFFIANLNEYLGIGSADK